MTSLKYFSLFVLPKGLQEIRSRTHIQTQFLLVHAYIILTEQEVDIIVKVVPSINVIKFRAFAKTRYKNHVCWTRTLCMTYLLCIFYCRGTGFVAASVPLFRSGRLGDLMDVDTCNSLGFRWTPLYVDKELFIDCSGMQNTGKEIGYFCLPDYSYQVALQKHKSLLQMVMKDSNYIKQLEGAGKEW